MRKFESGDNRSGKEDTLRKSDLVQAISNDADVRADVVRDVLNALTDIAVEEIVNNGRFIFPSVFSIRPYASTGYTNKFGEIPPHRRIRGRLSPGLLDLFRYSEDNEDFIVTRNNWRDLLRALKADGKGKPTSNLPEILKQSTDAPINNEHNESSEPVVNNQNQPDTTDNNEQRVNLVEELLGGDEEEW